MAFGDNVEDRELSSPEQARLAALEEQRKALGREIAGTTSHRQPDKHGGWAVVWRVVKNVAGGPKEVFTRLRKDIKDNSYDLEISESTPSGRFKRTVHFRPLRNPKQKRVRQ